MTMPSSSSTTTTGMVSLGEISSTRSPATAAARTMTRAEPSSTPLAAASRGSDIGLTLRPRAAVRHEVPVPYLGAPFAVAARLVGDHDPDQHRGDHHGRQGGDLDGGRDQGAE